MESAMRRTGNGTIYWIRSMWCTSTRSPSFGPERLELQRLKRMGVKVTWNELSGRVLDSIKGCEVVVWMNWAFGNSYHLTFI